MESKVKQAMPTETTGPTDEEVFEQDGAAILKTNSKLIDHNRTLYAALRAAHGALTSMAMTEKDAKRAQHLRSAAKRAKMAMRKVNSCE